MSESSRSTLRDALNRFALLVVVAVLAVAAGAVIASNALAEQEALRDASIRTQSLARGLAATFINADARAGGAASLARLDQAMRARLSEGGFEHVVIWGGDGQVIWADAPGRAGESYRLSASAREALENVSTVANLPGEREAEVDFLPVKEQLEVYVGALARDGKPFVLEALLPPDRIDADRAAVLPKLLAVSLGSLLLFCAAVLPLALSLARRVDEAQRLRSTALDRSVASWRHQRRLLAQELHDGVIQDLAAVGYGAAVLAGRPDEDPTARAVLSKLRSSAEHAERALRSIVLDLTPRRLADEGLPRATHDLVRRYRERGFNVELMCASVLDYPEGTGVLAYRVVREGLRNVEKHADAHTVAVVLRPQAGGEALEVEIIDDGRSSAREEALRSGQGLRLLADTLTDAGGSLVLEPGPRGGTRLWAAVPPIRAEPGRP